MRPRTTLVWTAAVVLTAAPAFAGDLQVPRQYATINDAAAAAQPGDRIVVHGGRHSGVVIAKDGVTLVGRGATLSGNAQISGSNVTVSGFRIRGVGGCDSVVVTGDDAVFVRNRFIAGLGHISLTVNGGARTRIENNRSSEILVLSGDGAIVRGNRSRASGISVYAAGATVDSNIGPHGSIWVHGANAVISGNRALDIGGCGTDDALVTRNVTTGIGIHLGGNRVRVTGNRTTSAGIAVDGDDASIVSNTVNRSPFGLRVLGSRADVHDNVVHVMSYSEAYGEDPPQGLVPSASISVVGSVSTVTANDVVRAGSTIAGIGDGIQITGDSNVVAGNHVSAPVADGIVVAGGSGNTLTGNVLDQPQSCGVLVSADATGTIVSGLSVSGGDIGLVNAGADTSVSDSTMTGGRVADILDVAGFQLFGGNSFVSLSHDALLLPQR